ncbi:uncharacterized protein SPAPADRAFT_61407 [Spathaspora passalidarum NRRL Y-27907]|uniref:Uncharacterized protein n=1 Tax=Spathaspora passalidarum (strain NRRL Y-27907 / 11-Y1) TaxID=619300 RepID=G3AQ08_SPAPN|nr:uncharacterized protein SPAPADRAFT_61407 [Spathaspora passalidarum NRRL Y-27907]EGW32329.1 hypothetical protein SPAPADRAFT_61407 [Spathaspora passalidarum NRRL Y-27907]
MLFLQQLATKRALAISPLKYSYSSFVKPQLTAIVRCAKFSQKSTVSNITRRSASTVSPLRLLFSTSATLLTASLVSSYSSSLIYNDAIAIPETRIQIPTPDTQYHKSRFNNKLNYEELTIGSVTGMFLGIIIGKLSSVFLFVTLASYFLVEFLESRNIINIPWNYIITVGREKIDVKKLVLEKPSFKFSFVLAFIIAAYNV